VNTYLIARFVSPRRSHALALLTLFAVAPALAGCSSVRLIGDYDETIDHGVTEFHQKAETYFAKLQSDRNTACDQGVYDDLNARMAVLKARAVSLPKYGIIATQIDNMKKQIEDMYKLDKMSARPLANSVVEATESSITVSVESILKLELALKRGDDPPDQGAH
jgi:hypothetical protein